MTDVDLEAVRAPKRGGDRCGALLANLPGGSALATVDVPMLRGGQDVKLLASVRVVAVTHEPKVLQHVQGPVHGRRNGRCILRATALDQLGTGDVPIGSGEDLDHRAALRRPAEPAPAQAIADAAPRLRQRFDIHRR